MRNKMNSYIWDMKRKIKSTVLYDLLLPIIKHSEVSDTKRMASEIEKVSKRLSDNKCFFLYLMPPDEVRIRNLSKFEKERLQNWTFDFNSMSEEDALIIKRLYYDYSVDEILKLYEGAKVIERNKHKFLVDYNGKYVHIIAGKRVTVGQPESWNNRIHIYGSCTVRGTGVEDKYTISSILQSLVNRDYSNKYQCVNYGIGCGSSIWDDLYNIKNTLFHEGDIIILLNINRFGLGKILKRSGVNVEDSSKWFDRPHSYDEWFTDSVVHTNRIGNSIIATQTYNILRNWKWISEPPMKGRCVGYLFPINKYEIDWNESIEEYKEYLNCNKINLGDNVGAIVMNCNPFSKGHRFLVEQAALLVDILYVFVVEEDKSFFPFKDRFNLVKQGLKDIQNVVVLRSGEFIISAITFPGYFYKDNNADVKVDTTLDIDLFGRVIAPILGIKKRFVGNEPFDKITWQYNNSMREMLPSYGIELIEISRKEENGVIISASLIRKALEENDWQLIETLVPECTYNYLIKRYRNGKS